MNHCVAAAPTQTPMRLSSLLVWLSAAIVSGKGCTAVPKDKCGKDFDHSCLKCGTKSDYDCEQCCPGCTPVDKPPYKYCDCSKGPPPGQHCSQS